MLDALFIYSLATLQTVTHGSFNAPVSPPATFPLPCFDTFDAYDNDTLPTHLGGQGGAFSVIHTADGASGSDGAGIRSRARVNGVLEQMSPKDPGPNAWTADHDPISLIGDLSWTDVRLSVCAKLSAPTSTHNTATGMALRATFSRKRGDTMQVTATATDTAPLHQPAHNELIKPPVCVVSR